MDQVSTQSQILNGFRSDLRRIRVPLTYHISLFFVAIAMVVLPLIYVGIIGLFGYGMVLYAQNYGTWFGAVRSGRAHIFLIVVPLFVGGLTLLFMVKPLFAPLADPPEPQPLKEADQPILFAFIRKLVKVVGAPFPKRICIDGDVNASAGLSRGFASLFSKDLTLTIGLPLVAGFSVNQLAGVLAHEFGHFAQTSGMRLTFIIRSVNFWFHRVVYERDVWDQRLDQWMETSKTSLVIAFYGAKLMVWLTRRVLWVLMSLGHLISCFMLRQMEYDADRYETALVGKQVFASTARSLTLMSVANHFAEQEQAQFWEDGKLCKNLPRLIACRKDEMDNKTIQAILADVASEPTRWDDTHPSHQARIDNAYRYKEDPIFNCDLPATNLFTNFDELCTQHTKTEFRDRFDRKIDDEAFKSIEELTAHLKSEKEAFSALGRYFQCGVHTYSSPSLLKPMKYSPPKNIQEVKQLIQKATKALNDQQGATLDAISNFKRDFEAFVDKQNEESIRRAGFAIDSEGDSVDTLNDRLKTYEEVMNRCEYLNTVRFFCVYDMLSSRSVQEKLENGAKWHSQLKALYHSHASLHQQADTILDLRKNRAEMLVYFANFEGNEGHEPLIRQMKANMRAMASSANGVRDAIGTVPVPFEHHDDQMTLQACLLEEPIAADHPWQVFEDVDQFIKQYLYVRNRVLGQMAKILESVEEKLGFPPGKALSNEQEEILWSWTV